jgi:hypothetical protein
VTSAGRSRTTSSLLRVHTRKSAHPAIVDILWVAGMSGMLHVWVGRWRALIWVKFAVLTLVGGLLFENRLLGQDHVTNLEERVQLYAGFGDHVVDLHDTRKGRHGWTRPLGVVHAVAVAAREVTENATGGGDLECVSKW